MAKRKQRFRAAHEVKRLARERIGAVPPGQVIRPKKQRPKPKHPKRDQEGWAEA